MRRDVGAARPATLGRIALAISIAAAVGGGVLLFVAGYLYGPAAAATADLPPTTTFDDLPAEVRARIDQATVWFNVGFSVYVVLALWGGILGVTAFVRRQGRKWAAWAMVVALVGGLAVLMAGAFGLSLTAG